MLFEIRFFFLVNVAAYAFPSRAFCLLSLCGCSYFSKLNRRKGNEIVGRRKREGASSRASSFPRALTVSLHVCVRVRLLYACLPDFTAVCVCVPPSWFASMCGCVFVCALVCLSEWRPLPSFLMLARMRAYMFVSHCCFPLLRALRASQ